MNEQATFTILIEETHHCGQIFKQIVTMKADPLFSFTLSSGMTSLLNPVEIGVYFKHFEQRLDDMRPKIELIGHYDKVEITGMEIKEQRLLCMTCGEDILFPERDASQNEVNMYTNFH